ncbi:uncharacterized protein [Euwallacea fornicatus]|uniref:uncharacterized protein n=1 Tax=Euwallacea fornicatus TaxID=995702 RepID=UPI00338E6F6D
MSTPVSQSYVTKVLPKSVANLKAMKNDEKHIFKRSSSIDTIKRINTYICSPQSYLLPAILTTWLKTGQKSLHSSAEKTIFMFRSVIFGSILLRFIPRGANSENPKGEPVKLDLQSVLSEIFKYIYHQLSDLLESCLFITFAFQVAVVLMTVELCLCTFYLSLSSVPIGLGFLILSSGYIVVIGHKLNMDYLIKRDVKRKIH